MVYKELTFFLKDFIYSRETQREAETDRGRSRLHAPGARCGIRSRVSRIAPWAKGRRQTAAPPRDPPELGVFMFCLPFWYFPHISSPFPSIPFHYYLYSPNEWEHTLFVLLRLTYFTQHNTLQFHPRWSKWWVFVISNSWVIFHCIHKPHLLYPFIFQWTPRPLPQFGYCGHCC